MNWPFGRSNWVEISDAHVITEPSPALAVSLMNPQDKPLWVRFTIDELNGRDDCENAFKLAPQFRREYRCPQRTVEVGGLYRAELRVYRDLGNGDLVEKITRIVEVRRGESGGLELVGRPDD